MLQHHDISRLDIPMNNRRLQTVKMLNRRQQLLHDMMNSRIIK